MKISAFVATAVRCRMRFRTRRTSKLPRLHFSPFGAFFLLAFAVVGAAGEQPESIAKLDLTRTVGTFGADSGVVFLTDDVLLISNGHSSPISVVYDIPRKEIVRTGRMCGLTGKSVWATPGGMLLSDCYDGLVLYDLEFRQIAKFQTRLDHYTIRNTLSLSPTHELVALSPFPKLGATTVLATATLTEVHSFPSPSVGMLGLYKTGYTVATYAKGMNEVEVSFYPFLGLQPILLIKREKSCWWDTFGISESELLKPCGQGGKGKVIDVNTAQNTLRIPDIESANFVQTSGSGKRFALGFQEYSKAHTIKQIINPFTYLLALGACCDDPSNLFRLRVYDQGSVGAVAEFHWKTNKNDPMWERYDNSAVALSPSGEYVAFLRGTVVEVYRIQDSPSH